MYILLYKMLACKAANAASSSELHCIDNGACVGVSNDDLNKIPSQ